jgi:hypothetical protein
MYCVRSLEHELCDVKYGSSYLLGWVTSKYGDAGMTARVFAKPLKKGALVLLVPRNSGCHQRCQVPIATRDQTTDVSTQTPVSNIQLCIDWRHLRG